MYINPRDKVFSHLERLNGWSHRRRAPVTLEVDLSSRCSLGCQSCHQAHTHTKGPWVAPGKLRVLPTDFEPTGDLADTRITLRWLGEAARAGVKSIVWTGGGEPTLHPDWRAIVEHARTLGLEGGLYTLGGHLDADDAHAIARCLTWVVVSLDCATARTYAHEKNVPEARFDAACQGIRHLSRAGATVGVSFLLHADNHAAAFEMLDLARSLGATYTTFRPTIDVSLNRPGVMRGDRSWVESAMPWIKTLAAMPDVEIDPARFAEWANWSGHGYGQCYGIRLNSMVTPDARVWACVNRRGIRDSLIGDLSRESFGDVWARHPGVWQVNDQCRAMCRLHPVNQTLAAVYAPRLHANFI